jgi:hypothetical protein
LEDVWKVSSSRYRPHLTRKPSRKAEIAAKKQFISSLPPPECIEDFISIAAHQKILGQKDEEYELILEKERVDAIIGEQDELHPSKDDCPICLEPLKISSESLHFEGCGGKICMPCSMFAIV